MNPILYQYFQTISDKIIDLFLNYCCCIIEKKLDISKHENFKDTIEKILLSTQSPKKDKLIDQLRKNFQKNTKLDLLLTLKIFIEIYQYSVHKDVFTKNFVRHLMKEILLFRNLFFHSTEYTDEHIFRFFEDCFHFFKLFEYPNLKWIEFDFPNLKDDDFVKTDLCFVIEISIKILGQKGFKMKKEEDSKIIFSREKSFFEKPVNTLILKEMSTELQRIKIESEEKICSFKIKNYSFPIKSIDEKKEEMEKLIKEMKQNSQEDEEKKVLINSADFNEPVFNGFKLSKKSQFKTMDYEKEMFDEVEETEEERLERKKEKEKKQIGKIFSLESKKNTDVIMETNEENYNEDNENDEKLENASFSIINESLMN